MFSGDAKVKFIGAFLILGSCFDDSKFINSHQVMNFDKSLELNQTLIG